MKTILCIPADASGNKLWVKDFRQDGIRMFLKYKSTYNDMPFIETEVWGADGGKSLVITGEDGTVLFRFTTDWIYKLDENE